MGALWWSCCTTVTAAECEGVSWVGLGVPPYGATTCCTVALSCLAPAAVRALPGHHQASDLVWIYGLVRVWVKGFWGGCCQKRVDCSILNLFLLADWLLPSSHWLPPPRIRSEDIAFQINLQTTLLPKSLWYGRQVLGIRNALFENRIPTSLWLEDFLEEIWAGEDEGKEAPLCFSFLFTGGLRSFEASPSGGFKIISFRPELNFSIFYLSHNFAD